MLDPLMESECLKVGRNEAETVRRELLRRGLLNLELRVKAIDGSILLPLKSG